jgi:DHA1 family inner membrane transport protein
MLRFECGVLVVATLLSALSPSYAWLTVGRGLAGIGGAFIFAVCMAAAADLFPDPAERNRRIGIIAGAGSVALIAGQPLLTQLSAHVGWRWAIASTLLPPLVVLAGTHWLPNTALDGARGGLRSLYRQRFGQLAASRETTWLLVVFVVMLSTWSAFSVYLGAYLKTELRASANATSLVFLVCGVSFTLGSVVAPRLVERHPKRRVHALFVGLLAVNFLGVGSVYASIPAAVALVGVTAFLSVSLYLITNILLLDSLPEARGAVMALQAAASELGVMLGAAWGGAALVLRDNDYVTVYRSLALLLPFVVIGLILSARAARPTLGPASDSTLAINPSV